MARSRSRKAVGAGEVAGAESQEPKNPVEAGTAPVPVRKSFFAGREGPGDWKQAGKVLDRVTAIRTLFPDFNRATRVGGLPTKRVTTIHGPTHGGKTSFILGLLRSFVDADHVAAFIDAEHATPLEFVEEQFGRKLENIPNFFARRPKTYEETVDAVDEFLAWVKDLRKEKPDLASIIVVDSINKLVPEREFEKLRKEGADALDKGWGRYRAAMNQAWLDKLVPMLAEANCAFVIIAQERDEGGDEWENGMPINFSVKGGKALRFDASLVARVEQSSPVRDTEKGPVVGFEVRVRVWKLKVGRMEGRYTDCIFRTSNGVSGKPGFDLARDHLEIGKLLGVVKTSGSWALYKANKWQSTAKAVAALNRTPALLQELMEDVAKAVDVERATQKAAAEPASEDEE